MRLWVCRTNGRRLDAAAHVAPHAPPNSPAKWPKRKRSPSDDSTNSLRNEPAAATPWSLSRDGRIRQPHAPTSPRLMEAVGIEQPAVRLIPTILEWFRGQGSMGTRPKEREQNALPDILMTMSQIPDVNRELAAISAVVDVLRRKRGLWCRDVLRECSPSSEGLGDARADRRVSILCAQTTEEEPPQTLAIRSQARQVAATFLRHLSSPAPIHQPGLFAGLLCSAP